MLFSELFDASCSPEYDFQGMRRFRCSYSQNSYWLFRPALQSRSMNVWRQDRARLLRFVDICIYLESRLSILFSAVRWTDVNSWHHALS